MLNKNYFFAIFYFLLINSLNIYYIVFNKSTEHSTIIQPTLTSTKSEGGKIFISNLNSFNVEEISAKFQSTILRTDIFYCNNINILNETTVSCDIPGGVGEYFVIIKDSVHISVTFWSFELGEALVPNDSETTNFNNNNKNNNHNNDNQNNYNHNQNNNKHHNNHQIKYGPKKRGRDNSIYIDRKRQPLY